MLLAAAAHMDTTGLMEKAGEMFLFHAPALIAMGLLAQLRKAPLVLPAMVLLVAGLGLFCGDMLMRALEDTRLFPMAAPTGGMTIIASWGVFALAGVFCGPRG